MQKDIFWASLGCIFFSFSLSFFFFFFFSKLLWIVFKSHSLTFWHEMSQYYSTWIPKRNQHNLASRWRQLKILGRWETCSFPLLWLSFCLRFSIMNPHTIPSDNTIQTLIFIMVKTSQCFFVVFFSVVTLHTFWSSVSLSGTHLALSLLIPMFSSKIWCADALPMLNLLATPAMSLCNLCWQKPQHSPPL